MDAAYFVVKAAPLHGVEAQSAPKELNPVLGESYEISQHSLDFTIQEPALPQFDLGNGAATDRGSRYGVPERRCHGENASPSCNNDPGEEIHRGG